MYLYKQGEFTLALLSSLLGNLNVAELSTDCRLEYIMLLNLLIILSSNSFLFIYYSHFYSHLFSP